VWLLTKNKKQKKIV